MFVGKTLDHEPAGADVFYRSPIPPQRIESIVSPGDVAYDRFTGLPRGRQAGYSSLRGRVRNMHVRGFSGRLPAWCAGLRVLVAEASVLFGCFAEG
ncbi:hypothetical protein ACFV1U_14345 [Streptomyces microflavus]|uniref:hypothetical protein n=1 Tax=Streptomyces microflavus TaxID=1919 RepID=UPI0036B3D05A